MLDDYSALDSRDTPEFQEYLANRKYRRVALLGLLFSPFITWGILAVIVGVARHILGFR